MNDASSVARFSWMFVTLVLASSNHSFAQDPDSGLDGVVFGAVPSISVTINQASEQADPTSSSPINFTVVFSEFVSGFTANDVYLAGSTVSGNLVVNVTGSGSTYGVSISGMTGTGTVVAAILPNVVMGPGATTNSGSTSTDNTVSFTPGMLCDSNSDSVLSVADIFYDIHALFGSGPAAPAYADCNGDDVLTVADIFFLINHLFFGGPAPL